MGCILLTACEKETAPVVDLVLDKTELSLIENEEIVVTITSGNGSYKVISSDPNKVTVSLADHAFTVKGEGEEDATVVLSDKAGRSIKLEVTVKARYTVPAEYQFAWNGEKKLLDKVDGPAFTMLTSGVAVPEVAGENQYYLSWTGGFGKGVKSNAVLQIVSDGVKGSAIELNNLEVVKAENDVYFIVFSENTKNGELYFSVSE